MGGQSTRRSQRDPRSRARQGDSGEVCVGCPDCRETKRLGSICSRIRATGSAFRPRVDRARSSVGHTVGRKKSDGSAGLGRARDHGQSVAVARYDSRTNPEGALEDAQSQLEMSNVPLAERIPAGKGPRGETLGTRINGTAVARPYEGQVIGRSFVDARYVIGGRHRFLGTRPDQGRWRQTDDPRSRPLYRHACEQGESGEGASGTDRGPGTQWRGRRQIDIHCPNERD